MYLNMYRNDSTYEQKKFCNFVISSLYMSEPIKINIKSTTNSFYILKVKIDSNNIP